MARCEELLQKAHNEPGGLRFSELCKLAECYGFERARQKGSHVIYKCPGISQLMNFQDSNGKAKSYQVRQLLSALADLGVLTTKGGS